MIRRWLVGALVAVTAPFVSAAAGAPVHDIASFTGERYVAAESSGSEIVATVYRRQHGVGSATVDVTTSDGTARTGDDYSATSATMTLAPIDYQEAPVPLVDDTVAEPVESFSLGLSRPTGGVALYPPRSATAFIVDDDGAPRISFLVATLETTENRSSTTISVVRAGDATGEATVSYAATGGTANPGADYAEITGSQLTFSAGQRVRTFTVSLTNDSEKEANETVELSLSSPSGAELSGQAGDNTTTSLTIIDDETDDGAPTTELHVPSDGDTYRRLRYIHLAVSQDSNGVALAEVGLRKTMRGGGCRWWDGTKFRSRGCAKHLWLSARKDATDPDFWVYDDIPDLPRSRGGKVRLYTAFARATDNGGQVERAFERGRNVARFEIR